MRRIGGGWPAIALACASQAVQAAQPLVTDDINTQGAGNHQLEFNLNRFHTADDRARGAGAVYTIGVANPLDVAFGVPYQSSPSEGFGDSVLFAKWRFRETESGGMALRPEISLPTGNERRGLGNGAAGVALLWIGTVNISQWSFHANLGMTHVRYRFAADREANRRNLWRASAAAIRRVGDRWQLVADTGVERNAERGNDTLPAFLLAGVIYSPIANLDVDFGYRAALSCRGCSAQVDRQLAAGVTWRF